MAQGRKAAVRKRMIWLFVIVVSLYAGLACHLACVQCFGGERYRKWAQVIRSRDLRIPAVRGGIYDRAGRPLALTIQAVSIFANRNEAGDDLAEAARRVAVALGRPQDSFEHRLAGRGSIVYFAKRVDPRTWERVRQQVKGFSGIGVERQPKRVYPSGSVAAQVIGFTNGSGNGAEGIERTFDRVLTGEDGAYTAELDAQRRVIPETRRQIRSPRDGRSVYLTIDLTIQSIAEAALAKMAKDYNPESACAIVINPSNGEILALANYPAFDPNNPASNPKGWRNRAVADLYEPGSTLKTATVAAALEEGISEKAIIVNCTGAERIGRNTIRCSLHRPFLNGHGPVDMRRLIEHSCNIGALRLARRIGAEKLTEYHRKLGLLDRQSIGLGCEAVSPGIPPSEWCAVRLANVGFGQGIAVTALQMAGVYCTVANHGVRMEPRLVKRICNPDGSVYRSFSGRKGTRVISEESARALAGMLESCVLEGTGKNAQIPGRSVAGKTGSAQIAKATGGFEPDSFVASFMGFAPVHSPRLVVAVVVTKPRGSHWGATVAAPVFKEIVEKSLWYLRVPLDKPADIHRQPKQDGDSKRIV